MIVNFADAEAEKIFQRQQSRKLPSSIHRITYRKLLMLHAAIALQDLRVPPGNRLEKLKGDRNDEHSIRVNDQWRICFLWKEGNAHRVTVEDYH